MIAQMDLNADLGEGGLYDHDLMTVVTSCNIACGGHAGDEGTMRAALMLAKTHGVAAGAHPSFPDRENFGRERSSMSGPELEAALISQITHLNTLATELGVTLKHLKPHGALYNMAAKDAGLATSILTVLNEVLPGAKLVGPPNSKMERLAQTHGVTFVAEGFADRTYEADGQLRSRGKPDAIIHDNDAQTKQVLQMATRRSVTTFTGEIIPLPVETICVHGDTPDAFSVAKAIKASLVRNRISVCPVS